MDADHNDQSPQQFHIQKPLPEEVPLEYPEEKKSKNIVGLTTKAAPFIPRFGDPKYTEMDLPKLYEHYVKGGITSGLEAKVDGFFLNGKPIAIYSGEIHYFRVHPRNWRDRLRKMRACGLNCVSMYIPWNIHEPERDKFDFGDGDYCYSLFADVATFMRLVYEEDLFLIIKPGPFISGDWELGGIPSWLLRIPNLKIRTTHTEFMIRVEKYFSRIMALCKPFQFQKNGPIIAVQIENEYGLAEEFGLNVDPDYMTNVRNLVNKYGVTEMPFTVDRGYFSGRKPANLENVLMTTCFSSSPVKELNGLKNHQPDKPCFVSAIWSYLFDHWMSDTGYNSLPLKDFAETIEIVLKYPASFNIYMFHGGTNWGFLNGASIEESAPSLAVYQPNATSCDFEAPIGEGGEYNESFTKLQQLLRKYVTIRTRLPVLPSLDPKISYLSAPIKHYIPFQDLIRKVPPEDVVNTVYLLALEHLEINRENGQSFGYILYRKKDIAISNGDKLKIMGHVRDTAMVMVDGVPVTKPLTHPDDISTFGFWGAWNGEENLRIPSGKSERTLDILVENCGRGSFSMTPQSNCFKGLVEGPVLLNGESLHEWEIYSMDFRTKWIKSLSGFVPYEKNSKTGPGLYHATLTIDTEPMDTWLEMSKWKKGIVFVNGYNIGRYLHLGPQTTLFCPSGFLRNGKNEILIFEHYQCDDTINFADRPLFVERKKPILMN